MNRSAITSLVIEKARRFGDENPQEQAYLQRRLGELESQEVLDGLLDVFIVGEPPPEGSPQQELAGRLLEALKPHGTVQLGTLLRRVAPRYELSVEQFPQHLANICGRDRILIELEQIKLEPGTRLHHRALDTMAFWLGAELRGAT